MTQPTAPTLSICVPTYNRRDKVVSLVEQLLQMEGDFEVCVHVDGSTDGTWAALQQFTSRQTRLKITMSENEGVGRAQLRAIHNAAGKFIMKLDDEDRLYPAGLEMVLRQCATVLDSKIAGFIFQMDFSDGREMRLFPKRRSNLIKNRADYHVTGDKKEVVKRDIFLSVSGDNFAQERLIPMSLYWARISRKYDILCYNEAIGRISYSIGGVSDGVRSLARKSPHPIYAAYKEKLSLFFLGRYRNVFFALKSAAGVVYYGSLAVACGLRVGARRKSSRLRS